MLVAAVKYLWNTNLKDVRADIAEYRNIRKNCNELKKTKKNEFALLRGENGCIKIGREDFSIVINNSDVTHDVKLLECEQVTFTPCKNMSAIFCTDTKCPYFEKNKNYITACRDYEIARLNKKKFWGNKFARVKQSLQKR